ncbi:MAG: acyltransferase family protein [Neoaquamicrobium sediminum]|uniref:acyltransferase family protein n=1 Tax=Neoaquamicrobium sediminum TaxID=1849104 RepID=UPI004035E30C
MQQPRALLPEIQGLRAVAVGLVLIFHIWPSALPGGYVGVDVFFVISGYLITGLLVRAALRDGHISLLDFYARRARRLLPAATAVLAATFAGMFVFLPEARWEETARQIAASALYVQNWMLAWLSVDYLGAENAASPVQHYWSLSIEEQFYFVWPLVMIGAIYLSRRFDLSLRRTFVVALSFIFVASLATSMLLTAREPAQAYFVTHTRMWELALGGLLALTIHRVRVDSQFLRAGMALVGFAAIVWSAFAYSPATPFPGTAALAPTIGTALLIVAGDVRLGFFRGLNAQWLTWIGDRSYSIYLWHWPLVVFYTVGTETVGLMDGLGLLALTLVLSHLCYEHIEQRYRHGQAKGEWKPLAYGLASIVGCVAAAGALQYSIVSQAAIHVDMADARYPGPAALLASAPVPEGVETFPSLAALKRDLPVVYGQKCHQNQVSSEPVTCTLGDPDGEKIMAITGDSHAAQWVPALDSIARKSGWKLMTFTKSACAFSRVEVRLQGSPYTSCIEWREKVIDRIKELGIDTLFTSQSRYGYIDREIMAEGLRSVWTELSEAGIKVVPIKDTPWMPFEPGDCLAAGDPASCSAPRADVEASDIFAYAASTLKGIPVIDMTDGICGPQTCDTVVGNIIVWRDHHHLTATYVEALAPYLAQQADMPAPTGAAVVPAADASEQGDDGSVTARLSCEPLREGSRAVERRMELQIENGKIAFRYGDWEKQKERYDLWLGTVQDGRVTMEGSYIEGAGGVKPVSMSGKIEKGQLLLKGKRGPRDCTVSAKVAIDTRA